MLIAWQVNQEKKNFLKQIDFSKSLKGVFLNEDNYFWGFISKFEYTIENQEWHTGIIGDKLRLNIVCQLCYGWYLN